MADKEPSRQDIMFWKGFEIAIDLIRNVFANLEDRTMLPMMVEELIEEEVERYKKDE